jgi:hypothetical protein
MNICPAFKKIKKAGKSLPVCGDNRNQRLQGVREFFYTSSACPMYIGVFPHFNRGNPSF